MQASWLLNQAQQAGVFATAGSPPSRGAIWLPSEPQVPIGSCDNANQSTARLPGSAGDTGAD
jgi:hypothetical protein